MTEFNGYDWAMTLCPNNYDPLIEKRFPSKTAAEQWLRENYPSFFAPDVWRGEGVMWFQYGTGYHWAQFQLTPRPSDTLGPEDSQEAVPD